MTYQGEDRRTTHDCIQQEEIGRMKEYISNNKGVQTTLRLVVWAIAVQIGKFLFLCGQLTQTVTNNTDYLWNNIAPEVRETTRNVDKILAKLDSIRIVSVVDNAVGGNTN